MSEPTDPFAVPGELLLNTEELTHDEQVRAVALEAAAVLTAAMVTRGYLLPPGEGAAPRTLMLAAEFEAYVRGEATRPEETR